MAAEIRRRLRLLAAIGDDPHHQAVALAWCARDPVTWINDWVWTYDPRNRAGVPKRLPFRLWPRQEDLVRWLFDLVHDGEPGLLKKGRDVGATWIMAATAAHLFTFTCDAAVTFGSRKEGLVDALGDMKAILPKVRFILDALPPWMRPQYDDAFLRLRNLDNGSIITGEGGDQMGRGGRSTVYFADEFAFVPRAEKADAAIGDNANTVVYLSTSNGVGTVFWRKERAMKRIFRLNYRDDPWKAPHDEWKAAKLADGVDPATFAREHEMDDSSAIDNLVIPGNWVMACVEAQIPAPAAGWSVRQSGLDVATTGKNWSAYVFRRGPRVERLEAWRGSDTAETADRASEFARQDASELLAYDGDGVGAGVQGELRRQERELRRLPFKHHAIRGGSSPTETRYADAPELAANERFVNLRAELWWQLRIRAWKTWCVVNGTREFPGDELLSLPDDPVLVAQLTSPTFHRRGSKIAIESKEDMERRGIASPDRADACCYAFAPLSAAHFYASFL